MEGHFKHGIAALEARQLVGLIRDVVLGASVLTQAALRPCPAVSKQAVTSVSIRDVSCAKIKYQLKHRVHCL